jgi:hypothetical protein
MKLDEVRFKRTSIQMQFAMMMQQPEEEETEAPDNTGSDFDIDNKTEGRKLKKS